MPAQQQMTRWVDVELPWGGRWKVLPPCWSSWWIFSSSCKPQEPLKILYFLWWRPIQNSLYLPHVYTFWCNHMEGDRVEMVMALFCLDINCVPEVLPTQNSHDTHAPPSCENKPRFRQCRLSHTCGACHGVLHWQMTGMQLGALASPYGMSRYS